MANNQQYNRYVLQAGYVSEIHFNLLMEISTIRSEKIRKALRDYFISGDSRVNVCSKYNVSQGNLSLKIKEVQILNKKAFELNIHYDCSEI